MKNIRLIIVLLLGIFIFPSACRKTPEPPKPGLTTDFEPCVTAGSASSFEIMTFNLAGFPRSGSLTVATVASIIRAADPDVIALQEMVNVTDFDNLLKDLPGWEGRFYPISNDEWNLAYLFKTSEVTIDDSKTRTILNNDTYAFPRPPFEIQVTHKSLDISAYLINIHLKCCGSADDKARRRDAAAKLDDYISTARPGDAVIVLGDFNDAISGTSSGENVFYNFVNAPAEYRFADMDIAKGSLLWWSYPTYPSHIDHILVTNELFSRIDTTMVIKAEPCYPDYLEFISDHRSVEIRLK